MALRALLTVLLIGLLVATALPPAAANHEYEQPVWFTWDKTDLDVIILAIEDPWIGLKIKEAIAMWEAGIAELAPQIGITLRVYWPAVDPVPPAGFNPDIAVVPQGFMAVNWGFLGFAAPTCYAFAPMMAGWPATLRVAAHEFGHCLGLGHVFNHGSEYSPNFDLMGNGSQLDACPSNLNAMVLQRVFNGQTGTIRISAANYYQADC